MKITHPWCMCPSTVLLNTLYSVLQPFEPNVKNPSSLIATLLRPQQRHSRELGQDLARAIMQLWEQHSIKVFFSHVNIITKQYPKRPLEGDIHYKVKGVSQSLLCKHTYAHVLCCHGRYWPLVFFDLIHRNGNGILNWNYFD